MSSIYEGSQIYPPTPGGGGGGAATTVGTVDVQNQTASTLIGRGQGAGAGPSEEITVGSGLAMVGTTISATGVGQAYTTIEEDGVAVTQRSVLDVRGNAFAVTDSGGETKLDAHAKLENLASATLTNGQSLYSNGSNGWVAMPTDSTGRSLLNTGSASAARTVLNLGTAAIRDTGTADTNVVQINSGVAAIGTNSTSYQEIATPANPAANVLKVYSKDVAGVTKLATLDSSGTETILGESAVSSVFGRTGAVVAATSDYDASQVDFTPAGGIAATDVQAAIAELDSEKQPLDAQLTQIAALDPTGHIGEVLGVNGSLQFDFLTLVQDATVGATGANYTSVAAAAAAGETRISVVSNATETTDVVFLQSTVLTIHPSVVWDTDDNQIRILNNNVELTFNCLGTTKWSPTTSKNLFDSALQPFTADITTGSPVLTNVSVNTNTLYVGQVIRSPDVPNPSLILSIDSPTQITLDANATNTVVGASFNQGVGFTNADVFNLYFFQGFIIDISGGTSNDCYIYGGVNSAVLIGAARIWLPNQSNVGFPAGGAQIEFKKAILAFLSFTAGTNVHHIYNATVGSIDEIVLVGFFSTTDYVISTSGGSVGKISFLDLGGTTTIKAAIGGTLSGYQALISGSSLDVDISANGSNIRDGYINAGNIDIGSFTDVTLYNTRSTGTLDLSDTGAHRNKILSCKFDGALVLGGNDNRIAQSEFVGGITDNGLRNTFIAVQKAPTSAAVIEGIDPLDIAYGGTNAATATAAFDNLAPTTTQGDIVVRGVSNNVRLAVGTNGQVLTSNGTTASWQDPSGGGGHVIEEESTPLTQRSALAFIGTGLTAADDAGNDRTTVTLDATLNSLSALGTAADRYAYTTGVDTWAEGVITSAGRALLDDASAAAQRTTLSAAQSGANTDITSMSGGGGSVEVINGLVAYRPIVSVTGTSKTLALTDRNTKQVCSNASTQTVTIPLNSSVAFAVGTEIEVIKAGAGNVTLQSAVGVTVNGVDGGSTTIALQYQGALLVKTATDTWILATAPASTSTYSTVQEESSSVTQRSTIAFIGAGITAADDSGNARTTVTLDATLNSLSALGTAANKFAYTTGTDTWAEADITAAGRAILDDADASAQRTTLGLGTVATESTVPIAKGGTGQTTATAAFDALAATTTEGDLIYRNATTNTRLPIGTTGQVLTSNGTTVAWQAPTGGVTIFDATVGATGATYTTVKAAVDAGKRKLLVIDDTLETADISVNSSLYIQQGVAGKIVDLDNFRFVITASNTNIFINGLGDPVAAGNFIAWSPTSAKDMFVTSGAPSSVSARLDYLGIDATGATATGCRLYNPSQMGMLVENLFYSLPNLASHKIETSNAGHVVRKVRFLGGGSSTGTVLEASGSGIIADVELIGDFSASANVIVSTNTLIDQLSVNTTGAINTSLNSVVYNVAAGFIGQIGKDNRAGATGVTDGDKGDIAVTAFGSTWTIDPQAVTYAKIQNVSATDKILGRQTAGAGSVEEITCTAAARSVLDDASTSAMLTTLGAVAKAGDTMTGALNWATPSTTASAATVDLGGVTSNQVIITGTTTITSFGSTAAAGTTREIRFEAALTLTHHATNLILPGGANITTAQDDTAAFRCVASGQWLCLWYKKQDGTAIVASGGGHVIAEEGSSLSARPTLNFVGTGITASDDSGNNRTNVTTHGSLDSLVSVVGTDNVVPIAILGSYTSLPFSTLSQIAVGNNTSSGFCSAIAAVHRNGDTMQAALNWYSTQTIASAATVDIGTIGYQTSSNSLIISGTTTITSFGTASSGVTRELLFSDALTLTHNATSLILPGGANITTAPNDTAAFRSLGSGNWVCLWYKKQNGQAIVATNAVSSVFGRTGAVTAQSGDYTATQITNAMTTNTVQEFTTSKNFDAIENIASGSITWALASEQVRSITLNGNLTISGTSGGNNGGTYILILKQDATGSRTITWHSSMKWPGGTAPVLSTAANSIDAFTFIQDNGLLLGVGQKAFS